MYAKRDFKIQNNASGLITSASLVVNGNPVDCSNGDYNGYTVSYFVEKLSGSGSVQIEKVQGSNDITFASGVIDFDNTNAMDHFGKSDTTSSVDALSQTIVSANGVIKALDFHPMIKTQYYRPIVKILGATDLNYVVFAVVKQKSLPVNQ